MNAAEDKLTNSGKEHEAASINLQPVLLYIQFEFYDVNITHV